MDDRHPANDQRHPRHRPPVQLLAVHHPCDQRNQHDPHPRPNGIGHPGGNAFERLGQQIKRNEVAQPANHAGHQFAKPVGGFHGGGGDDLDKDGGTKEQIGGHGVGIVFLREPMSAIGQNRPALAIKNILQHLN